MKREIEYIVQAEDEGKTIGDFLRHYQYSRSVVIGLKKTVDGILKNGLRAGVREHLESGDRVKISLCEHLSEQIEPTPFNLSVLYEDEDILVIDKPADTPTHPSVNNYGYTLANYVMYYFKEKNEKIIFRCINRLDRDTTGITIIAKHALSAGILAEAIQERRITRTYQAIVEGVLDTKCGTINLPIGRAPDTIIKRQVDEEEGQRAVTHYQVLQVLLYEDKYYSLVELKLETGRTHQIRVHMEAIGHPLIGDFLYNPQNKLMERQALHAWQCIFTHPITGREHCITSPLPKDIEAFITQSKKIN